MYSSRIYRAALLAAGLILLLAAPSWAGDLKADLVEQLVKDGQIEKEDVKDALDVLEVEETDLNGNGTMEMIVRALGFPFCGAANCPVWVYARENGQLRMILAASGTDLVVSDGITGGYADLISAAHISAAETYVIEYGYDGREYKPKKCEIQQYDEKGNVTVIPDKCGE